jgi:hypothetical protein
MADKKKPTKKKRTVSKHVLKARSKLRKADFEQSEASTSTDKKSTHVKAPSDAATYLTDWENRNDGTGAWKFNKNTQSWLIRHMYVIENVAKGTFSILLKYLDGLEGASTRSRIRVEASRRALRYKEYTKNATEDNSTTTPEEASKDEPGPNDVSKAGKQTTSSKEDLLEEEKRWGALDDNAKRKEYKRARQILETVVAKD